MIRLRWAIPYALALLLCAGCGDGRPPLYPVEGVVVFDSGEPVRYATVELVPKIVGPSPRGKTDTKGRFTVSTYEPADGAPAGEYRVVVIQVLPPQAAEKVRKLGDDHQKHGSHIPVVSLKYASPDSSELSITVSEAGSNKLELVVEPR